MAGKHLQQPVHVADLADAVLNAAERPAAAGSCYDVAGPEPIRFAELLRAAARAVGSRTRFMPVPLAAGGRRRRGYELLSPSPRIRAEQLQRLAEDKAFCHRRGSPRPGLCASAVPEGIQAEARTLGLAAGAAS